MILINTNNEIVCERNYSNVHLKGECEMMICCHQIFQYGFGSDHDSKWHIKDYKHQWIAYPYDVVLLLSKVEKAFKKFENEAKKYGLLANENKTKYMKLNALQLKKIISHI